MEILIWNTACERLEDLFIFVSAYNLVGACNGGITYGEVANKHQAEVGMMCKELASFVRCTLAVSLFSGIDERLEAYAKIDQ